MRPLRLVDAWLTARWNAATLVAVAGGLADDRRWAGELASKGETPELRSLGRTIARFDSLSAERRADALRQAAALVEEGPTEPHRRAGRVLLGLAQAPPEEAAPQPSSSAAKVRRGRPAAPHARLLLVVALGAVLAGVSAVGGITAVRTSLTPSLNASGPPAGVRLNRAATSRLAFTVRARRQALASQRWLLDGHDVKADVRQEGAVLVLHPGAVADGKHVVEISARRKGFFGGRRVRRFSFVVDTRPPRLELPKRLAVERSRPVTVAGVARGAVRVAVGGRAAKFDGHRFSIVLSAPVPAAVRVEAVDEVGNRASAAVPVALIPRRPDEPVRAVHVTAYGWADRDLRAGVLKLIAQHRINAVELDLKDEGGLIGFAPDVPLGRRIGATQRIYSLERAVRDLHAHGVRVIGRVVCFRDPVLAEWAWKHGKRELVVQTPSRGPYSGYGGFTNFANAEVRRYNIDIALAGVRLGVDEVLYDYVRRPDGPISSMRFPGLRGTPEHAIVDFLRETRLALAPYGTYLGASVFGVAATRPREVAQDIPRMARQVDYIAPMVYPSHWAAGEYDVPDPNADPYRIVVRSLRDFRRDTRGSGARVVPWLQDFSLGRAYGATEVRAQIAAAAADGLRDFILWDPAVTYTAEALTSDAKRQHDLARPAAKPKPVPQSTPAPPAGRAAKPKHAAGRLRPNELGVVPVIMHHEIRPDRVGAYDQTPAEFRHELEQLWQQDYWPVRAEDLVARKLDAVPAGKTPVVLTFDDATRYQFSYRNGKIDPATAIGVMLEFARAHPGFPVAGTVYVLREPFGGTPRAPSMLRWLVAHGFELGNHTYDHLPLRSLSPAAVQKELVKGRRVIADALPEYDVKTMALPLGSMPRPESLARHGRWHGQTYRNDGVFLVGANPAPSPYSTAWNPAEIPRIRSSHLPYDGAVDFTWAYWSRYLRAHETERYVSDADPWRISFPPTGRDELAPRFR